MTVLYLDKAQAANLILASLRVPATPDVREEVMTVLTRLVKSQERELSEAARLRDELSASLAELMAYVEERAEVLRVRR